MTGRDPVDIAEQRRDYDETHGSPETRLKEQLQHEAEEAEKMISEIERGEINYG